MAHSHDVCQGKAYTDRNGEKKKKWIQIGAAFTNDQGQISIKMETLPIADMNGEVWLSLFTPKPRNGQQPQAQSQAQAPQGGFDGAENIPF